MNLLSLGLVDGLLDSLGDLLIEVLGEVLGLAEELVDLGLEVVIDGAPDEEDIGEEPDKTAEGVAVGEDGKEAEDEEARDGHADILDKDDAEDSLEEGVDKVTTELGSLLDPVTGDLDLLSIGGDGVLDLLLGDVLTVGDGAIANSEAEEGGDEDEVDEEGDEGVLEVNDHVADDVEDDEGEDGEDDVLPVEDLSKLLDNLVVTEGSEGALAALLVALLLDRVLKGLVLFLNNGGSFFGRHYVLPWLTFKKILIKNYKFK